MLIFILDNADKLFEVGIFEAKKDRIERVLTLLGRIRKMLKSHICASTILQKTLNRVKLLDDSLKSSVMGSYKFSLIFIKQ